MFIQLLYVLKQINSLLTNSITCVWMILALVLCEPVISNFNISPKLIPKIMMSLLLIIWWVAVTAISEHPSIATLLFFLASASNLILFLYLKPRVRKSLPSGLSSVAYGIILYIDMAHLGGTSHLIHFGCHILLMVAAVHTFVSIEPAFKFISYSHHRVLFIEIFPHVLMGCIDPIYWFLVAYFVLELVAHKL